jgi:predicted dehydrogenase/threonine dehydrogenase-like Zn-dependent dehydrogenase
MLQALVKKGQVIPEAVPAPVVSPGSVLLKVVNSCISAGTEVSTVQSAGQSLIRRALDQPDKVKKVFDMARTEGIARTLEKVQGNLSCGNPIGYSVAGVVLAVGAGVQGFSVGDRVAAAGAGIANHAEVVDIPKNLAVPIPSGVSFLDASSVALGSIAMQGLRRADMRLGEIAVVFGSGILGQLCIQMLRGAGIRVVAIDLDNKRLEIAKDLGAELVLSPRTDDVVKQVQNFTRGFGADAVVFTAATQNSEPLSQAFRMCRKKGKVILVGVSGMEIRREDIYAKELDFLVATSYGPGRYDEEYEKGGVGYPYAYVRWTENRNMEEYLRLVQQGVVKLERLIQGVYPIEKVGEAFEALQAPDKKPLILALDYGDKLPSADAARERGATRVIISKPVTTPDKIVKVALVGAGGFATGMHLPHLVRLKDRFKLIAIVDQAGNKAKDAALRFGAGYATSDINDVLKDSDVDIIFICTRHGSHAELALQGLAAGKHVFVEKPLASLRADMDRIVDFYKKDPDKAKPLLMVGFNRRFSRYAQEIKKRTANRIGPMVIHYRMNAGYMPADHWVHQDGGRIIGEGCHIIDLMNFLTGATIISVGTQAIKSGNHKFSDTDNRSLVLGYSDGSVCTIDYFANGARELSKEYMEVHFDEKSIVLDDYKELKGYGLKIEPIRDKTSSKGHFEELIALHDALRGTDCKWPIPFENMVMTTEAAFLLSGN